MVPDIRDLKLQGKNEFIKMCDQLFNGGKWLNTLIFQVEGLVEWVYKDGKKRKYDRKKKLPFIHSVQDTQSMSEFQIIQIRYDGAQTTTRQRIDISNGLSMFLFKPTPLLEFQGRMFKATRASLIIIAYEFGMSISLSLSEWFQ